MRKKVLLSPFLQILTSNCVCTGMLHFILNIFEPWTFLSLSSHSARAIQESTLATCALLGAEYYAHGSDSCCSENVLSLTHNRQRSGIGLSCSCTCSPVNPRLFSFPFLSRLLSLVVGKVSSLSSSEKRETRICLWFPFEVNPPKLFSNLDW